MKRKRRRNFREERAIELRKTPKPGQKSSEVPSWPGGGLRYATVIGIALIMFCTVFIYVQTVQVPPIDYEELLLPCTQSLFKPDFRVFTRWRSLG
jgi:hypothetical protein